MTNLTEQWKKGELKRGKRYWCKLTDETTEICYLWLQTNRFTTLTGYQSNCLPDEYIPEVLAPVPSYEQWQSLNELLDSMRDTNKVLAHRLNLCKKLLIECNLLLIKQQANDEVEYKESAELVLRIEEVLK